MQLQGKEREEAINDMVSAAVKEFRLSKEQAQKRVNALLLAMDNGLFDGIPQPTNYRQCLYK